MRRVPVVRVRPAGRNEFGDPDGADGRQSYQAIAWPRTAGTEGSDYVPIGGWNVLLPQGADIKPGDLLEVDGRPAERVDGDVADYGRRGILVVTEKVGA